MLSFKGEIPLHEPLTSLTRFHNTITGITPKYEIIQVDTRNFLIDKSLSFMDNDYNFPKISDCKYLRTNLNNDYYFSFEKKIMAASGAIVEQSNSKADFVRGLDASQDLFVFGKYHKVHNKYSLNLKKIGNQKKILSLFDQQVSKIGLISGKLGKAVAMETSDESVRLFYGEDWQTQQEIPRVNKFQIDHNYIYLMSGIDRKSSPPKMNHFNSNNSPEGNRQMNKVRVQVYDLDRIAKGKGYSQFQFNLSKFPIKMDSFQTDIIIAFENSLEIYDIRKITKPFQRQNESGIKDFYYEPNLQKIYLSSRRGLLIFDYK